MDAHQGSHGALQSFLARAKYRNLQLPHAGDFSGFESKGFSRLKGLLVHLLPLGLSGLHFLPEFSSAGKQSHQSPVRGGSASPVSPEARCCWGQ